MACSRHNGGRVEDAVEVGSKRPAAGVSADQLVGGVEAFDITHDLLAFDFHLLHLPTFYLFGHTKLLADGLDALIKNLIIHSARPTAPSLSYLLHMRMDRQLDVGAFYLRAWHLQVVSFSIGHDLDLFNLHEVADSERCPAPDDE